MTHDAENPASVEYWLKAKAMVAAANKIEPGDGLTKQYALLAGITVEQFHSMPPEEIHELYQQNEGGW